MKLTDRVMNAVRSFRGDMWEDQISGRGGITDKTRRLTGNRIFRAPYERMKQYQSNGFLQNVIEQPAEDATREWIEITTNRDEDLKINRIIENRLKELKIQSKLKEFIKLSRMYEKGSMIFYGVDDGVPQTDTQLMKPMNLTALQRIHFINVIEEPDRFFFFIMNRYDPTKSDYNKVSFYIMGRQVHESRISWLVNNWYPMELMGVSIIETVEDSVGALDSALWSASSIMQDYASNIFKSDLVGKLEESKLYQLLWSLKNQKNTQSVVGLKPDETFEKTVFHLTGVKEVLDFITKCLSGTARIPEKILFGMARGVVGIGDNDTLGYYANIAKFQENQLREIIQKIIDMVIHEQTGDVFKALGGGVDSLDVEFEFNSLFKLDPLSQADAELKGAQRDQIDISVGKMTSDEARTLDPRMDILEDFDDAETRDQKLLDAYRKYIKPKSAVPSPEDGKEPAAIEKPGFDPEAREAKEKDEGVQQPEVKSNFGFRRVPKYNGGETI